MKAELFSAMFAGLASSPDLWSWLMARPAAVLGRVSARTYAVPKLVVDNTGKEQSDVSK